MTQAAAVVWPPGAAPASPTPLSTHGPPRRVRPRRDRCAGLLVRLAAGALCAAALAAPAAAQPHAASPAFDDDAAEVPTAPVTIDGRLLFTVRGASSLPAHERAQRIRERIEAAAADPGIAPEAVRAVDGDGITLIMAGDRRLLAIANADARLEAVSRDTLARYHVPRIAQAMVDYRAARSSQALRRAALRIR